MKTTRKRYSADFEAKVALEAIRGDLTLAELAAKHGVHHAMIAAWKRQAIEGVASTFSGAGESTRAVSDAEVEKLHAKIGQLVVERDLYGLSVKGHTDLQQRPQRDRLERGISCITAKTIEGTVSYFLPVPQHQSSSRIPSPRFQALARA